MIDIKELSEQDLKQKIDNIKAEREKTANALKKYEEELERRKQEATKDFVTVEKKVFDVLQKNNLDLMEKLEIAKAGLRFLSEKSEFAKNLLKELENDK